MPVWGQPQSYSYSFQIGPYMKLFSGEVGWLMCRGLEAADLSLTEAQIEEATRMYGARVIFKLCYVSRWWQEPMYVSGLVPMERL